MIAGFFVVETYVINVFQAGVECQETHQNFLHPKYFGVLYRTNRHPNMPPPPLDPSQTRALDSLMYPSRGGSGIIWEGGSVEKCLYLTCFHCMSYAMKWWGIMAGNMLNGMLDFCLNNS